MSDVKDDVEEMLRNELLDLAARPQPEPVTMLRRVRHARRRSAVAGAAIALIIVVAGAVVWLGRDPASLPPTDPPLRPEPLKFSANAQIHFPDPDHGFALVQQCPHFGDQICTPWLASTSDGGLTWLAHEVAALKGMAGSTRMRVFDASRVTLEVGMGTGTRLFTEDAGRTWKQVRSEQQPTIAMIPPLAQAKLEMYTAKPLGITVYLPDGTTATLATPPAATIISGSAAAIIAKDGSVWVQGSDDTRTRVLVSRDHARTWTEVPLPAGLGKDSEVETHDGRHVYVANRYAGNYGIWRTNDDGKTWQQLQLPVAQPKSGLDLLICPTLDGGLFLSDYLHSKEFRIDSAGHTFGPPTEKTIYLTCTAGSRYVRGSGDPYEEVIPFAHSADGKDWTELRF